VSFLKKKRYPVHSEESRDLPATIPESYAQVKLVQEHVNILSD
jgi:hypothetical protein